MPISYGIIASQVSGHLVTDTGAMFPIGSYTVPSAGANSVSFTSIPSTYSHLQIRAIAKNNQSAAGYGSSTVTMAFNGDTTYTNYRGHNIDGSGSGTPSAYANQASGYYAECGLAAWGNSTQTSMFAAFVCDILDYTTTKNKTVRYLAGKDGNGGGDMVFGSSLWMSSSPISSITFYNYYSTLNFSQFSSFALYGIKA